MSSYSRAIVLALFAPVLWLGSSGCEVGRVSSALGDAGSQGELTGGDSPDGGGTDAGGDAACAPETCPNGCCDGTGVCQDPAVIACGQGGNACVDCSGIGDSCAGGACSCGGGASCSSPLVCNGGACLSCDIPPGGALCKGVTFECDESADCSAQFCCLTAVGGSAKCKTDCAIPLCRSDAECGANGPCVVRTCNGFVLRLCSATVPSGCS